MKNIEKDEDMWYEQRVAVELFFERLMESENLPYESEERKAVMEEGNKKLKELIEKVFDAGVVKGEEQISEEMYGMIKPVTDALQERMVVKKIAGMSERLDDDGTEEEEKAEKDARNFFGQ